MTPRHLLEPGRLAGAALLKAQSDTRLVDLTRAGNDRAFEAIVERYNAQLLRYCSRILPDGRGEDAVQQTFLKAYDAIHRDTTPLSLRGWLFGIAHNVSLNVLRQRGSDHEPLEAHDQPAETADATVERRERFREVLAAVAALPPGQRDALLLRELEGRGHEEIARELGVSGGAARQLISRARNGIRSAAAAVMPLPFVMRLTDGSAGPPTAERLAELTALGTGVTVSTVVATAAVGTTLIGGAAVTGPDLVQGDRERRGADVAEAAPSKEDDGGDVEAGRSASPGDDGDADRRRDGDDSREGTSGDADDDDRSGRRDGDDDDGDDRSGPGDGDADDADDDNSGPGSGDDSDDTDNSGPGSGDDSDATDNSGPGSGGDTSGGDGGDSSGPGSGDDSDAPDLVEPDDDVIETDRVDEDNSGPGGGSD